MSEQLFLQGFDTALQPTDRLFFAIAPTPDAAASIARQAGLLRDEYGLQGRLLAIGRLHVTLNHLGDYLGLPQDIVVAAMTAAASVRMAPFDVAFDRVASFRGRRTHPFVLLGDDGCAALTTLQQTLGTTLEKAGIGRANSHYTPHVTLLYDNRFVSVRAIEPIGWTVREFILLHSLLGRTRHVALARWPLLP